MLLIFRNCLLNPQQKQIQYCSPFLVALPGDEVRSKNARTDSNGSGYEFCFPITTKKDSENVKQSLVQFYSRLIGITEEKGIQMEAVKSKGVALTDCIWSLVLSNIACLGRVVTLTKGNKVKNVGYFIASGESGWVLSSVHFAFHAWNVKLHGLSPLTPYIKWHVTDRGAGNTSGMKKCFSSFDNESIDDSQLEGDPIASDSDRGGSDEPELDNKHLDKESNSESEEEMGDIVVEKTENGLVPYST